jgi:nitrogen fixation protein FixH
LAFVRFSFTQDFDLVSEEYYEKSLEHTQHMEAMSRVKALGDDFSWKVIPETLQLAISFPERHAQDGLTGEVILYRPSDADLDRKFPITVQGVSSVVLIDIKDVQAGNWKLLINWESNDEQYVYENYFQR